jgi:hypothetical protein
MINILTQANLDAGIQVWLKLKWPCDFHNQRYKDLEQFMVKGLNGEWWQKIVDVLCEWKAIRPLSKAAIYQRGLGYLNQLCTEYNRILLVKQEQELDLGTASWDMLSGLYIVASSIKNVSSPVFGSKLCHFIIPNAFPVIDNYVIGIGKIVYQDYWSFCSTQWRSCDFEQGLIQRLRQEIVDEVAEHYPWSTKITELCIIGSRTCGRGAA